VALAAMWGSSFLFNRVLVQVLPPLTVVATRVGIAAVVLTLAAGALGQRLPRAGRAWGTFLVLGGIGTALPFYLISWGQQEVGSGLAGILMAGMPLATMLLAFLLAGELLSGRRVAGFVVGFAGIAVLLGPAALGELGGPAMLRQAAVIMGALCYAVTAVLTSRMVRTPPLVSAASMMLGASVWVLPVALLREPQVAVVPSFAIVFSMLWLGVVSTAVATIVYFRLVASAGPTFLSMINYLIPLVAVAAGAAVLGERLAWNAVFALALLLAGLWLAESRPSRRGSDPPDGAA
jgi:drug/metabolite transporter (DMT)-like permease